MGSLGAVTESYPEALGDLNQEKAERVSHETLAELPEPEGLLLQFVIPSVEKRAEFTRGTDARAAPVDLPVKWSDATRDHLGHELTALFEENRHG